MVHIHNELLSAVLQVLLFTLIPFIFFLFRKDKGISFLKYIGLHKASSKSIMYALGVSILFVASGVGLSFVNHGIREAMLSPKSVTGKLRLMGFSASSFSVLLIIALIKTSLSEEILFRGFLAKRLIRKFGFRAGNIFQSIIFGAVHLILFWALTKAGFIPLTIIFLFSSFAAGLIGLIKEKYAGGSILPGWIAHGLGNTLAYSIIAFII